MTVDLRYEMVRLRYAVSDHIYVFINDPIRRVHIGDADLFEIEEGIEI